MVKYTKTEQVKSDLGKKKGKTPAPRLVMPTHKKFRTEEDTLLIDGIMRFGLKL